MAIKGKRKTQRRGGQARKRPATAPRPVPAAPRVPWYRRPVVVTTVIVVLVIAVGAGAVFIANARSESERDDARRELLDNFTGEIVAVQQRVDPIASAMVAAAGTEPSKNLKKDADGWDTSLEEALVAANQVVPPPGTENAAGLLTQSIQLYQSAARTYAIAADVEGKEQTKVLERAADQITHAGSIWQTAIVLLDTERADAELGPSQIALPGSIPAPLPSPAATGSDGGAGNNNEGKKSND